MAKKKEAKAKKDKDKKKAKKKEKKGKKKGKKGGKKKQKLFPPELNFKGNPAPSAGLPSFLDNIELYDPLVLVDTSQGLGPNWNRGVMEWWNDGFEGILSI